jgi:hypothetical protein
MWVDLNAGKPVDELHDWEDGAEKRGHYCADCGEHHQVIDLAYQASTMGVVQTVREGHERAGTGAGVRRAAIKRAVRAQLEFDAA